MEKTETHEYFSLLFFFFPRHKRDWTYFSRCVSEKAISLLSPWNSDVTVFSKQAYLCRFSKEGSSKREQGVLVS
jgi:hypothetical protein